MGDKLEARTLAEEIIGRAIQEVAFKYSAYTPILSSFRIIYSDLVPTMGVDKYARLIANPEFVVKNQAYINAILIHEVLHVFFGHTNDTRTKLAYTDDSRHNEIANIAEDCAINQFIHEQLPDECITPLTLRTMLGGVDVPYNRSAEEYYDLIEANLKQDEQLVNAMCSTGEAGTQTIQDALDKMGVEHISEEEVNERVLDTAVQMCKSQGGQYGGLVAFARELIEPQVNWQQLLQATIKNAEKKVWNIHERNTYKRVSKRSGQILLPKKHGRKISVVLTFDTSGSISSDMVNQFLSEIQNCMRYSEIKECALWHTQNYWYGTPRQLENDIEKVFQSGGTAESCMGEAEKHCKADLYIHFSDGYHGNCYGFEHPHKHIEILWDGQTIKEIRKEF